MQTKVSSLFAVLILILSANFSFAQAPLRSGANYLACVNYNDGPGSSDMTLVVQLDIDGNMVVNEGAPVTYVLFRTDSNALGDSIGMEWVKDTFDDSGWEKGVSAVGFADGDDNTEVNRNNPAGQADAIAIYTRYRFNLASASSAKSVILRADFDDAYACWLNGVEAARSADLVGKDLKWNTSAVGGAVANHESTNTAKGTPNANRKYQVEVQVQFVPVVGAAVQPAGKLATSWGKIKAHY